MAIDVSKVQRFESGFLVITTGGTTGPVVLGLKNISLKYSVETEDFLTFESNRKKQVSPTFTSWNVSCSGEFLALSGTTGEQLHPQSGDTHVVGSTSGAALLESIKTMSTTNKIYIKMAPNNYQSGTILITSYEVSADAGSTMQFSLEMQGISDLVKSTS